MWVAVVLVATALMTAGGMWLPGWGLRYGLVRALHEAGWPRVTVFSADLSLFKGAVVVRELQAGDDLGSMLGIGGLDLRFRWKPLFSRRVSVERLNLSGVDVDVVRQGETVVVNGLPLTVSGGESTGPLWSYDVTALSLADSRIHVADGSLKAVVEVDRLDIQDLRSWEPDTPVRYALTGRINGATVAIQGTATPFATEPAFAAQVRVDGFVLAAVADVVRQAGGGALSGRLDVDAKLSGGMAAPLGASGTATWHDGGWTDGTVRFAAKQVSLALDSLRWDGDKVALAGTLGGQSIELEDGGVTTFAADSAKLAAAEAGWDGKGRKLSWRGGLHADRHRVAAPGIRIEHASLDWTGSTRFDFAAQATSFVHAEGRAEVTGAALNMGDVSLNAERVATEGVFEHARPTGMLPPLAGAMTAEAEQLALRSPGREWLTARKLDLRDIKLAPGAGASLGRLEAQELTALAQTGKDPFRPRLEARRVVLERANLAADGAMAASALTVDGVRARVTRTADGILGLPAAVDGGGDAAASLPKLALGRLRIGDGRVDFRDRSLAEPVSLRFDDVDVTADALDTARPDRQSPFTAKARLGVAQIAAEGRVRPFAAVPDGTLKASLKALELTPLSAYVADALGVHVQTGQLDADIAMTADQGKLAGNLNLLLSQFFIAQPDPDTPLAKSADMPVETVLDLLRDGQDRIRLSIPVGGDLSNPNFDISDAVGQAVGGALQTAVFTTLKVAFPLAGLISLVIDDAESRRLALEPLGFAPGLATLDETGHERLAAVAGLMKDHDGVTLTLCGVATQAADAPALAERQQGLVARLRQLVGKDPGAQAQMSERDRLLRLADSRAQAAKAFLAEQGGIDPGRLFVCRSRVETEETAVPRVDMVL